MSEAIFSVRDLTKVYPNGVRALTNVAFDVQPGEFLVIIGLSGSGKTTLLRCLNRLIDPTAGEMTFQGLRVDQVRGQELLHLRREIAMIFQTFNLVPRHSALTNVLTGRLAYTPTWRSLLGMFPAADIEKAMHYLKLVGIEQKALSRADQLSGGQQQRVAIARALCQQPKVLLADEPVASLDPATCHVVMDYLRKANRELGITVICNLHFLSLVREYADRVIALRDGELVFSGSPKEINENWFKQIYGQTARDVYVR